MTLLMNIALLVTPPAMNVLDLLRPNAHRKSPYIYKKKNKKNYF
jgi:hypothetical protein